MKIPGSKRIKTIENKGLRCRTVVCRDVRRAKPALHALYAPSVYRSSCFFEPFLFSLCFTRDVC